MIRTPLPVVRGCTLLLIVLLAGCSSFENFVSGDKVDYKSVSNSAKTPGLEVPPDLTQLSRETRYQQGGAVSAATFQADAGRGNVTKTAGTVAPQQIGDMRIERQGNERWLVTALPAEQLWPQLQAFWKERGFTLVVDQADAGVMETEWAENRAKLPNDIVRNTLGRVFDSLYSTGERDKFRTRVERTRAGTEVYITHRGMVEVFSTSQKDSTVWQPRPADPQLEAEFLQRLMVKLGVKEEAAKGAATAAAPVMANARVLAGQAGAALQVDDGFDRAWRRVGLALDRGGFTVEDRDRAQGLYFVRYIDPGVASKSEPGFFAKLLSFGSKDEAAGGPQRYRVLVVGDGERSTVSILNAQGAPETGDAGRRMVSVLVEDLK